MIVLSEEEKEHALDLAYRTIRSDLLHEIPRPSSLPPVFSEKAGVFVTLTRQGELRGCIGIPLPVMPLGLAIVEAASQAAFHDPRFPPVEADELPLIQLEITVLTVPEEIPGPAEERPGHILVGRHGLIIRGRGRSGLLLPQVAADHGWSPEEFLNQTCLKSGLPPGCWRDERIAVRTFEGQIFSR